MTGGAESLHAVNETTRIRLNSILISARFGGLGLSSIGPNELLENELRDIGNFLRAQHLVPCRHFSAWSAFRNHFKQLDPIEHLARCWMQEIARLRIDEIGARATTVSTLAVAGRTVVHEEGLALLGIAFQRVRHGRRHAGSNMTMDMLLGMRGGCGRYRRRRSMPGMIAAVLHARHTVFFCAPHEFGANVPDHRADIFFAELGSEPGHGGGASRDQSLGSPGSTLS